MIRKRAWKVPDLFEGGPNHIYWYFHGINPRAWFVYIITVIPSLRKSLFEIGARAHAKLTSPFM